GGARGERVSQLSGNLEGLVQTASDSLVTFGNGGLILTSADAGAHWRTAKNGLDLYLRDVATLPQADAVVATGQLGDIIRSGDGIDWQPAAIEYPDERTPPDLRAMTHSISGDAMIVAGPPGAILRSSATGDHWSLLRWSPLEAGRAYPWILTDRSRNVLVTVDAHGAMQVSDDDGVEWREIDSQTTGEFWHGAVLERAGVMIIAGKSGTVARSEDSGARWSQVAAGTDADLFGSYADETSGSFFLLGQNGVLLRSVDSGRTWQSIQSGTQNPLRRMVRDSRSGALIAFGGQGAIVRSEDDGAHWQSVDSGVDAELRKAIVEPGSGSIVIAGRSGVILRSADGGKSWERLPAHTTRNLTSITARSNGDLIAVGERIVHLRRQTTP
ncbi:MAG TPA: YCF48-related protein, partial [Povalibacter sp.]